MHASPTKPEASDVARGLAGVVAGRTAICSLDGDLRYRGYAIGPLAEAGDFEEVAFLVDGRAVAYFSAADLPGGAWVSAPMKSFANLWATDRGWAGRWEGLDGPLVCTLLGADVANLSYWAVAPDGAHYPVYATVHDAARLELDASTRVVLGGWETWTLPDVVVVRDGARAESGVGPARTRAGARAGARARADGQRAGQLRGRDPHRAADVPLSEARARPE